jgi:antirestriction protein ArdC
MRDLYQEVTDRIIAKLEAGTAPWIKGWNAGTQMPMNAVTNRSYSGINILLFWLSADQGYKSPRYLTYKQAQECGGQVRKGEKSTRLYFFKQLEVKDRDNPDETKKIPLIREYYVFNVDQCDNLPDQIKFGPGKRETNKDAREALADEFITATGADFQEGKGSPCYIPSKDMITVPDFADFHSRPEYYGAAFHELVHWTGAKHRLNRDLKGRFDTQAYAAEELIAELGAAFLCAEFGLDNGDREEQHAAYLESWLKLLKSDKKAIVTAASRAQKAADYLRELANAEPVAIAA